MQPFINLQKNSRFNECQLILRPDLKNYFFQLIFIFGNYSKMLRVILITDILESLSFSISARIAKI